MGNREELKPCPNPWCASTTAPVPVKLRAGRWRVECACGVHTFGCDTIEAARAAWNTRPSAGGEVGELVSDLRELALADGARECSKEEHIAWEAAAALTALVAERDGLKVALNVERGVLSEYRDQQERAETAERALREVNTWLTAALECKSWAWDPEQFAAADDARKTALAALGDPS